MVQGIKRLDSIFVGTCTQKQQQFIDAAFSIMWVENILLIVFITAVCVSGQNRSCVLVEDFQCPSPYVTFYLFTQSTGMEGLLLDEGNLSNVSLNSDLTLHLLIHGTGQSYTDAPLDVSLPAFLESGSPFNVIAVDYSPLSCRNVSRSNAPLVAKCVANFLLSLKTVQDVDIENVHVVGLSLGAQIAGLAAGYLNEGNTIGRITGLDPASKGYLDVGPERSLDSGDATFVDVIHSNAGQNGIPYPVGDVDFYVNDGTNQPGCENENPSEYSLCSHLRSTVLYAESINSKVGFYGRPCNTSCIPYVPMGEPATNRYLGVYCVKTNNSPPYA